MTNHLIDLDDLPEWGPDVPGTPVEVTYPDGAVELCYAWRDGYVDTASPDRKCRRSPFPWMRRITAVLADDPTRWVPVDARERVELGEHLVGARVCVGRNGATITGVAEEVDYDGWLWGKDALLFATEHESLHVHPADLAAAREAAAPKPPTCWDEWKPGDVWAWGKIVYRMDDDRVLRLASHSGAWVPAVTQPGGVWVTTTLSAPTEEHMARVAAADEADRLPEEPPRDALLMDRYDSGWEWDQSCLAWVCGDVAHPWSRLHAKFAPITVYSKGEVIP